MIRATNLQIWIGGNPLLTDVSFHITSGQRCALVGANGSGKTTLLNRFKLDAETRKAEFGEGLVVGDVRMAWVEQEVPNVDTLALTYVTHGDRVYAETLAKLEQALATDDNAAIAQCYATLDAIDAYTLESRASQILAGLGFSQEQMARPVNTLSGGWRIRLNLARALLSPSDLLLLDEPTNHLDIDAIYWLEAFLQRYQGTIVFVSHDQEFMDNLATHVIHLENGTTRSYTGNYESFIKQSQAALELQQAQYLQQQKHIKHLEAFVERFRYKATKARQAQSRIKMLDKIKRIDPVTTGSPFRFSFAEGARLPAQLASFRKANLGYDDTVVLRNINLQVLPGTKIGLLGLNGAGKSTLIKAFAGELSAHKEVGVINVNPLVKIGYFNQYVVDKLDLRASPIELLRRLDSKLAEADARKFLGGFNFSGDKVFQEIDHFSGGEKSRLALALIIYQQPNFLLLDEPTNHLDLEMRQALALALQDFNGSYIVVSHDRFLLSTIVDEFYLVADGEVKPFDGDLNDYHKWVVSYKEEQANQQARTQPGNSQQSTSSTQPNASQAASVSPTTTNSKPTQASLSNEEIFAQDTRLQRDLAKIQLPLRQQASKLETKMAKLQEQIAQVQAQFLDPEVAADGAKVITLTKQNQELSEELESCKLEWLELEEQLEQGKQDFIAGISR